MALRWSPRTVTWVMTGCIVILATLSVLGQIWQKVLHQPSFSRLVHAVALDEEQNLPTAYQALTLLASAILLAGTGRQVRRAGLRDASFWFFLALVFFYLFVDETFRIHERAGQYRDHLPMGAGRWFRSGWVIFGFAFAALVGLLSVRYLLRLPRRTALAFVAAGAIYIAGAGGVEAATKPWTQKHGKANFVYSLFVTVEEIMEMTGIVILIRTTMNYRRFIDPQRANSAALAEELPPRIPPTLDHPGV